MEIDLEKTVKSNAKAKGIGIGELSKMLSMSHEGLNYSLRNKTMSAEKLSKLEEILEVDLSNYFGNPKKASKESRDFADEKIAELTKIISELTQTNAILVKQNMELYSK
jgi:transcriptional regulator with XRE-family HTH domain